MQTIRVGHDELGLLRLDLLALALGRVPVATAHGHARDAAEALERRAREVPGVGEPRGGFGETPELRELVASQRLEREEDDRAARAALAQRRHERDLVREGLPARRRRGDDDGAPLARRRVDRLLLMAVQLCRAQRVEHRAHRRVQGLEPGGVARVRLGAGEPPERDRLRAPSERGDVRAHAVVGGWRAERRAAARGRRARGVAGGGRRMPRARVGRGAARTGRSPALRVSRRGAARVAAAVEREVRDVAQPHGREIGGRRPLRAPRGVTRSQRRGGREDSCPRTTRIGCSCRPRRRPHSRDDFLLSKQSELL